MTHQQPSIPIPCSKDELKHRESRQAVFAELLKLHPGNSSHAQSRRMLAALQILGSVTTVELARCADIFDPPARKFGLLQQGYDIRLAWDLDETEAGVLHRVGRYFMARDVATEAAQ